MAKTVLITGCSAGIGRATAEMFAANRWNVVATMRAPEAAGKLAEKENVLVTALDVTDESSIVAAVKQAEKRFGAIDVLVNNAGYGLYGLLEATSLEFIRKQFETNVVGLLAATRAVVPGMRKRCSGVVVNVGSIAGKMTYPLGTMYNGTKFAVEGISEALRFELHEIGVRVKLIEPGIVYTNFFNATEFKNDESLLEYQPLMQKFAAAMEQITKQGTAVGEVAEAIYEAATDGTDRLRYLVGDDAKSHAARLASMDGEQYFASMGKIFGLDLRKKTPGAERLQADN
ncbi:MAG: SDR family oxidoreductase [Acidobacteriaceae bacterium]